jgi:hypothetical protein
MNNEVRMLCVYECVCMYVCDVLCLWHYFYPHTHTQTHHNKKAPLLLGQNLATLSDDAIFILTNKALVGINQDGYVRRLCVCVLCLCVVCCVLCVVCVWCLWVWVWLKFAYTLEHSNPKTLTHTLIYIYTQPRRASKARMVVGRSFLLQGPCVSTDAITQTHTHTHTRALWEMGLLCSHIRDSVRCTSHHGRWGMEWLVCVCELVCRKHRSDNLLYTHTLHSTPTTDYQLQPHHITLPIPRTWLSVGWAPHRRRIRPAGGDDYVQQRRRGCTAHHWQVICVCVCVRERVCPVVHTLHYVLLTTQASFAQSVTPSATTSVKAWAYTMQCCNAKIEALT